MHARRVRAPLAVAAALGVLALALSPASGHDAARAAAAGPVLIEEDFRDATAQAEFLGYGSSCLTGAPAVADPLPLAPHVLGGCPSGDTGPVPPAGGAPYGYLQLTDASMDQAGAVLLESPFPSTSGVEITFEQWQYGEDVAAPAPADGIAFFLVDGTAALDEPGAFGGSLGYAQKLPNDDAGQTIIPGVNGGYLGVGLDVLGNYFGDWEQRGAGCAQRSPAGTAFAPMGLGLNKVTVRGPGNGTTGYCFLTSTVDNFTTTGPWPTSLGPTQQLQGPLQTLPPGTTAAEAVALLEPSRRTVTVTVTPAPNPTVTVAIDFNDGNGTVQVLSFAAPAPVPATFKLGFAASTGSFTDVHLIRTVRVQALNPLPELTISKTVADGRYARTDVERGDVIPYAFEVGNIGGGSVSDIVVTDPRIAEVDCPATELAEGESMTCTGEYAVTDADIAAGTVLNTATVAGIGLGGADDPVVAGPAESTVTLSAPTPPPTTPPPATPPPATPVPPTTPAVPSAPAEPGEPAPPGSSAELAESGIEVPGWGMLAVAMLLSGAAVLRVVRRPSRRSSS